MRVRRERATLVGAHHSFIEMQSPADDETTDAA